MSSNDEAVVATGDSFWDVGCYKRTVTRAEDGAKLCSEFMTLIQERAEIEKHYVKSLKAWSHKWNDSITKGPEYGTMEATWQASLEEADSLAEVHLGIKDKLLTDVQASIKQWKAENYHKPMVGTYKEAKQLDDDFRKAQKPWAKRYAKVQKMKKEYHNLCKLERSATNQENNARGDSSLSDDQVRKFQEKVEKCSKDVEGAKEKYEAALSDLNAYNPKYMEEMMEVFQRSQDAEEKRLRFFKEVFLSLYRTLDISANEKIPQLYEQFRVKVEQADHEKDLKYWSTNHGVETHMYWPTFEEYSPDMHSISRKDKKGSGSDGITLTSVHRSETNADPVAPSTTNIYNTTPEPTDSSNALTKQMSYDASLNPFADDGRPLVAVDGSPCPSSDHSTENLLHPCDTRKAYYKCENYDSSLNPFGDDDEDGDVGGGGGDTMVAGRNDARPARPQRKPRPDCKPNSEDPQAQNPFGDDDADHWDNYDNPLIDDGGEGVPIRALYDYEGEEEDELSFKVGDVFVKLQDKDEQGWCKGRKDGRVGLFPDNYTEVISQ